MDLDGDTQYLKKYVPSLWEIAKFDIEWNEIYKDNDKKKHIISIHSWHYKFGLSFRLQYIYKNKK